MTWSPAFYARTYGMEMRAISSWLAALSMLGAVGTLVGTLASDHLGKRDSRWRIWIVGIAGALMMPAAMVQFLAASPEQSLWLAIVPSLLMSVFVGPTIAASQSLVLPHMRATSAAVMLLLFNVFGLGLGPFFVGVVSDLLAKGPGIGADSLRYALVAAVCFEIVAVLFYIFAARHNPKDLARDQDLDFVIGLVPTNRGLA